MQTIEKCKMHKYKLVDRLPDEKVIYQKYKCENCGQVEIKEKKKPLTYPELSEFKRYLTTPFTKSDDHTPIFYSISEALKNGKRGLFFSDKRGTGKTHLAIKLLQNAKKKGKSIFALNFTNFLYQRYTDMNLVKAESKADIYQLSSYEKEQQAKSVKVLLLDEIGKGKNTDFSNGLLYSFIENVYSDPKKFIILTSNIPVDQLSYEFDPAVFSRLKELCGFVSFNHLEDFRQM